MKNKRWIGGLFWLLMLASTQMIAQSFNAGIQGGIAATQVTGDQLSGYDKVGITAGIFVARPIGLNSMMQLEMNYIQKGSRRNAQPHKGQYDSYLLRLNYIEMPLIYIYEFNPKFQLLAGLQIAYLINYKEKDSYGEVTPDPTVPGFNKYDFSAVAGLNFKLNEKVGMSFRFSYSILAIRPKPDVPTTYYDRGQFNDVLSTTFLYFF